MNAKPRLLLFLLLLLAPLHLLAEDEHLQFQKRLQLNGFPPNPFIINNNRLFIATLSGALYSYQSGGKIHPVNTNLGTLIVSPMSRSNRILVLNTSNILTVIHPTDSSFITYKFPGSTALLSLYDGSQTLIYGTDDHLLYGINLTTFKTLFVHYVPHLKTLTYSSNMVNATTWKRTLYKVSATSGSILKIIENSSNSELVDAPLLADRRFDLSLFSNNLISRVSENSYAIEYEGLNGTKPYKAFRFANEIFLYSFDGEILCFKTGKIRKPVLAMDPGLIYKEAEKSEEAFTVKHSQGTFIINDRWRFHFPSIDPKSLREIRRPDLNGDGIPDTVLLFNANRVLRYVDILLILSREGKHYAASHYSTVGNTNYEQIFVDLDRDRKAEMIIVNESPFNLSKEMDRRIFIPDIYTMREDDFEWDSYNYPEYYRRDLEKKRALAATKPFKTEWDNMMWANSLRRIITLENELATIKRQIASIETRQRDTPNKIGLSIWFYKKGVEFFRNNWDNLALLCFRNARLNNPKDQKTLYQISQVYSKYGMHAQALSIFTDPKAGIPHISSLDVYAMVEKSQDVTLEPTAFQFQYNLGSFYYELGRYRQASTYLAKALTFVPLHPECTRKLIDSTMVLNSNDKRALELIAGLQRIRFSKDLEDRRQTLLKKSKP